MMFFMIFLSICVFYYTSKILYKQYRERKGLTETVVKSRKNIKPYPDSIQKTIISKPKQPSSYSMSLEEFKEIIIPNLYKYRLCIIGFTDEDIGLLYDYNDFLDYQKHNNAKSSLSWRYSEELCLVAKCLRSNFEELVKAKNDGYSNIEILTRDSCYCLGFLNGNLVNTNNMLNAYFEKKSQSPLLPPPETICLIDGDRRFHCGCSLVFHVSFDFLENKKPIIIPENWREHLLGMANEYFEEKIKSIDNDIQESIFKITNFESYYKNEKTADVLAKSMKIADLRGLQRKHGISGYRTKYDIASQLISYPPAFEDVNNLFLQIKISALEDLKGRKKDLIRDKNYLINEFLPELNKRL